MGKQWLLRRGGVALMFLVLGVWGLVDAVAIYPGRGLRAADFFEYQYLDALRTQQGMLINSSATIADPGAIWQRLHEQERGGEALSAIEKAKLDWFTQLRYVGKLQAQRSSYPREALGAEPTQSAEERHAALRARFVGGGAGGGSAAPAKAPNPLTQFDIPSQWAIAAVGFAVALYLLAIIAKVRGTRYRWDASTKTLTLPDGSTLTPADISEYDKSKWDKFYVFVQVKPEHPRLGGRRIKLDLYRYVPLEDWVLAMEKASEQPTQA